MEPMPGWDGPEPLSLVWPPGTLDGITSSRVRVDAAAWTHPGLSHTLQNDYYAISRFERRMDTLATNLPPATLPTAERETVFGMLLAGGLGPPVAAEVASRTAMVAFVDLVLATPDWILRVNEGLLRRIQRRFIARLRYVNRLIHEQAGAIPGLESMGAALTVLASLGSHLIVASVGNAHLYHAREGGLVRLTPGAVAAGHQSRGRVLTRALGRDARKVDVEVHHVQLADGDQLLLCTELLSQLVTDETMADTLGEASSATEAVEALGRLALKAGSTDPVTALVARYAMAS